MRAIIDGVEKTSRSPLPICAAVLTPCAQVVIASPLIPCLFRVRTSHCAQGPAEAAMPSRSRTRTGLARSMRTKMDPGDREQGRHGLPVRQRHTPWSMLGSCAEAPRPSRAAPRPRLCPGCAASLSLILPSLFFAAMFKKMDRLKEGQCSRPVGKPARHSKQQCAPTPRLALWAWRCCRQPRSGILARNRPCPHACVSARLLRVGRRGRMHHLLLFLPGVRRKGPVAAATTHTDVPASNLGRPH